MQKESWLKETARDIIALAGLPFYLIAIIRISLAEHKVYTWQLIIGLVIIYILYFLFRKTPNTYASLATPLLIFTNLFYNNTRYLIFSGILFLLLLIALWYLGNKKKNIFLGMFTGGIASLGSYYLAPLLPV